MLHRSIRFLQPGEKLPIFPDNQIVHRNILGRGLEMGDLITPQRPLTMRIGVAKGRLRQV
jgi:hypothetical protein